MAALNDTMKSVIEECTVNVGWTSFFEKEQSAYDRWRCGLVVPLMRFGMAVLQFFMSWCLSDLVVFCLLLAMAYVIFSAGRRTVQAQLRPYIFYLRGVHVVRCEAMQNGSYFEGGTRIPSYQVEIYNAGALIDGFVGYGLRYDDILVVPTHVITAAGGSPLLKGRGKKVLLDNDTPIQSTLVNDVSYYKLSAKIWAILGVQSADSVHAPNRPEKARIVGHKGSSMGMVSKSRIPHVLRFTGSTLPGYSGAAYELNGKVVGIHSGESNGDNTGYCFGSLVYEIAVRFEGRDPEILMGMKGGVEEPLENPEAKGKNKRFFSLGGASGGFAKRSAKEEGITGEEKRRRQELLNYNWREDMALKTLSNVHGAGASRAVRFVEGNPDSDDWAEQSGYWVPEACPPSFLEAVDELSPAQMEALSAYCMGKVRIAGTMTESFPLNAQADDVASFMDVNVTTEKVETWQDRIERRLAVHEGRLAALEGAVRGKPDVSTSQPKKPFSCAFCEKTFTSGLGKITHEFTKHGDVPQNKESAIHGDETVEVSTSPFLGGAGLKRTLTSHWMKPREKSSKSSFPSKTMARVSTSQLSSPKKTSQSQKQLEQVLESLQKVISGLREEQQQ